MDTHALWMVIAFALGFGIAIGYGIAYLMFVLSPSAKRFDVAQKRFDAHRKHVESELFKTAE